MSDNRTAEPIYLPESVPPTNHGHTTAAWTAMIGVILGALIASIGCLPGVPFVFFWVGLVVALVALVVGMVMRNMGFGQPKPGVEPRSTSSSH